MKVNCRTIEKNSYSTYIDIGTKAYRQHYLHLWENGNASPYLNSSFTYGALQKEEVDSNSELFIIYSDSRPVGILKIIKNKPLKPYSGKEALLLEKIYLLQEYSGKGIGTKVLHFVEQRSRQLAKKVIWLDTMKNGPALRFYRNKGFEIHAETSLRFPTVLETERQMYVLVKKV